MTFETAFLHTVGEEGGFTQDPNDIGNWTGGKVGVGILKGTKYGISAASYPALDIANLTLQDAQAIYKRSYWDFYNVGAIIDNNVAGKYFDFLVNTGPCAQLLLQFAVRPYQDITIDGHAGPVTLAAVNAVPATALLYSIESVAGLYYWMESHRVNSAFLKYYNGWLNRAFS